MGSPILPFIGIGLTVVAVLFYIIATATNSWASIDLTLLVVRVKNTYGLWKTCSPSDPNGNTCVSMTGKGLIAGAITFSRVAMIVSILVAIGALLIPPLVYFKKLKKKFVKVSAGLIIGTAVLVLLGTISFAVYKVINTLLYSFGYSIILAWMSVPIAIVGGVLILLGGLKTPVKFMKKDVSLA
ncbi:peripheral myelin protein 22-like [Ptychodera flava]|uniref:peripheral myelin protein 22-like n=1 Tax=Ptychodera flava TaxID=63121 RepID=UPI00396A46E4